MSRFLWFTVYIEHISCPYKPHVTPI